MTNAYSYIGEELTLFAGARNWKSYVKKMLTPYLAGDILEVGAGIGGTSAVLIDPQYKSWTCLEPDEKLALEINSTFCDLELAEKANIFIGKVSDLPEENVYDTILYIDVLEHIEDDKEELRRVVSHLRDSGRLVILAPAHDWLYSSFDKEIGHYRRYNRKKMIKTAPRNMALEKVFYLDSAGFFLSLANRLLLKQKHPSQKQIDMWDKVIIPVSRIVDLLINYRAGKTVVGVWRKACPVF